MAVPKIGTVERIVLDKLMENENGATYLDFPPELGITAEVLDEVVTRLRYGIFDAESSDDQIRFDS